MTLFGRRNGKTKLKERRSNVIIIPIGIIYGVKYSDLFYILYR